MHHQPDPFEVEHCEFFRWPVVDNRKSKHVHVKVHRCDKVAHVEFGNQSRMARSHVNMLTHPRCWRVGAG